jgi:SNF2 family DNA or RNA helicase
VAVDFLLDRQRAVLADERGLGKTFPALEAAMRTPFAGTNGKHRLVVCPAYLIPQMVSEIARWDPWGSVRPVHRGAPWDPAFDWHVIGYHTLTDPGIKATPWIFEQEWQAVILDEAHRLIGRKTQWRQNVAHLRRWVKHGGLYLLTGTPQRTGPDNWWSYLNLFAPREFGSYWRFVDEWFRTVKTPWRTEVVGLHNLPGIKDDWANLLQRYALRRRLADHLPELPPVIPYVVEVELPPDVMTTLRNARKLWRIEHKAIREPILLTSGGALVAEMRRVTASPPGLGNPKLGAVKEILEDNPGQVVVFTWFRRSAGLVAEAARATKAASGAPRPVTLCTGGIDPLSRADAVERWKSEPEGVLVATLPSLQEGYNLQNASTVVFFEHSYVGDDLDQAIGRLHRSGQARPVRAYHVMTRRTIDTKVWRVAQKRLSESEALAELLAGDDDEEGGG